MPRIRFRLVRAARQLCRDVRRLKLYDAGRHRRGRRLSRLPFFPWGGAKSARHNPFTPILPVANNTSMTVDLVRR